MQQPVGISSHDPLLEQVQATPQIRSVEGPDEDQKEFLALRAHVEDLKNWKDSNCNARMNWNKKAPRSLKANKTYKN